MPIVLKNWALGISLSVMENLIVNRTTITCSVLDVLIATAPFWMYVVRKIYNKNNLTENVCVLQKCVTALEKTWHMEHFFCAQCGKQFGEEGFHEKEGKPYCRDDYFDMFAPKCGACNRAIMENYISALNSQWHPDCFVCRVSFVKIAFLYRYITALKRKRTAIKNIQNKKKLNIFSLSGLQITCTRKIVLCRRGKTCMSCMHRR